MAFGRVAMDAFLLAQEALEHVVALVRRRRAAAGSPFYLREVEGVDAFVHPLLHRGACLSEVGRERRRVTAREGDDGHPAGRILLCEAVGVGEEPAGREQREVRGGTPCDPGEGAMAGGAAPLED